MKRLGKVLVWVLLAAMVLTGTACAEAIGCAAAPLEIQRFENYPSYALDGVSGKWSVRANPADALLDRFWTYIHANSAALCAFTLEAEGSALTGVWSPVLRFYYNNGSRLINADAVSVLVDGVRYDFAASSAEVVSAQGDKAECISVPLNAESLGVVSAMLEGEEVQVRLFGDTVYTAELDMETTVSRRRIEAASVSGLEAAMALLNEIGVNEYALWDLSAAAWKSEHGFAPAFSKNEVVKMLGDVEIADDFGMVVRGAQTRAVKPAQEALIAAGFMSGSTTGTFGDASTAAAKRAQKFLGMIETGCMDAQLEQALLGGRTLESHERVYEWTQLGDSVEIELDRYWFADGVSAQNAPRNVQSVFNGDNTLLAADGMVRNISAGELRLFTGLEAKVVYGGKYEFEATVLCESDEGSALDMTMLPMAQARLVLYAEIPAYLAQDNGAQWTVVLSAGDAGIEYELQ